MTKKKILLLGGSSAQLIAIKRTKELGYYTIVCDYLPDNPGQSIADSFQGGSINQTIYIFLMPVLVMVVICSRNFHDF